MDKKYDFEGIGKRLPYKIPDNLFNDMESNVMSEVKRIPTEIIQFGGERRNDRYY